MEIHKMDNNTLIVADIDKYLILTKLGDKRSVDILGKIQAINITGDYIPEFEEREVVE